MTLNLFFQHKQNPHIYSKPHPAMMYFLGIFFIVNTGALPVNNVFAGSDTKNPVLPIHIEQPKKMPIAKDELIRIHIPHLTHTREETTKAGLLTSIFSTLAAVMLCPSNLITHCFTGTCVGIVGGCINAHDADLKRIEESDKDAYIISSVVTGAISGCVCSTCIAVCAPAGNPAILVSGAFGGLAGSKKISEVGVIPAEHILEYLYAESDNKHKKTKVP